MGCQTIYAIPKGTPDFKEWNGWFTDNAELGEIIKYSNCATPDFVELLYTDGYPNYYLICLSDNDPENPGHLEYGS